MDVLFSNGLNKANNSFKKVVLISSKSRKARMTTLPVETNSRSFEVKNHVQSRNET